MQPLCKSCGTWIGLYQWIGMLPVSVSNTFSMENTRNSKPRRLVPQNDRVTEGNKKSTWNQHRVGEAPFSSLEDAEILKICLCSSKQWLYEGKVKSVNLPEILGTENRFHMPCHWLQLHVEVYNNTDAKSNGSVICWVLWMYSPIEAS